MLTIPVRVSIGSNWARVLEQVKVIWLKGVRTLTLSTCVECIGLTILGSLSEQTVRKWARLYLILLIHIRLVVLSLVRGRVGLAPLTPIVRIGPLVLLGCFENGEVFLGTLHRVSGDGAVDGAGAVAVAVSGEAAVVAGLGLLLYVVSMSLVVRIFMRMMVLCCVGRWVG